MFIGERLAELRKDAGLQQKELAAKLGVKQKTISAYETGIASPSEKVKIKIAKLFSVSLDYLCGLIDEEIPFTRDYFISLPKNCPSEMKKEILNHIALLKIKYKIK